MLTIEKNIPIPAKRSAEGKNSIIWKMEIGDSVFVEGKTKAYGCFGYIAKKNGWKFATRVEGDGVRVWRIA